VKSLQDDKILIKSRYYKNVTVKWKSMRKITKYDKKLRGSFIKTAIAVIFLNILFLPQYTPFEKDGDNMFHLYLNGQEIGYAGKETEVEQLLQEARLELATSTDEIVFTDADLTFEGKEVLFGQINTDKELKESMLSVLQSSVRKTLKHAYTIKIKDYTVSLSSSDEVRQLLQAALNQYQSNNRYVVELTMDQARELNVMTAKVITKTESQESDTPAFPVAGMSGYFEDSLADVSGAGDELGFEDITLGLTGLDFGDSVEIVDDYLTPEQITPVEEAIAEVTSVQDKNAIYVVQSGDTLSGIAEKTNIPVEKIIELNDAIENEFTTIRIEQEIIITQPEPPLSIEWNEQVYYEEDYEADIVYVDNDDWYTTQEVTLQEPSAGHRKVAARVSYRNDKEIAREILVEDVTMEAVPKIVERGTKIPPSFIRPVSGGRLSSSFGRRSAPTRGASTYHQGVDWALPTGSAVYASSGGTVTKAGWGGGYGYCVYIRHSDGRETRYAHLSKVLVSPGQSVKQGQRIALSGNTGRSTGPHLHFEMRINGSAVNPLKYLNG